jgi:hypothetical protein
MMRSKNLAISIMTTIQRAGVTPLEAIDALSMVLGGIVATQTSDDGDVKQVVEGIGREITGFVEGCRSSTDLH